MNRQTEPQCYTGVIHWQHDRGEYSVDEDEEGWLSLHQNYWQYGNIKDY